MNIIIEKVEYIELAEKYKFPIKYKYSTKILNGYEKISPHQMKQITGNKFITEVAIAESQKTIDNSKINIILNNIQDYGNIGCIIRTAFCFGFPQITYVGDKSPWHHKSIEASRGLIFSYNPSFFTIQEFLTVNTLPIITTGTCLKKEITMISQLPTLYCLIFGNETNGIAPELYMKAIGNLNINIKYESLNVAVAAGILLNQISDLFISLNKG